VPAHNSLKTRLKLAGTCQYTIIQSEHLIIPVLGRKLLIDFGILADPVICQDVNIA
jgi:hypothetical protein